MLQTFSVEFSCGDDVIYIINSLLLYPTFVYRREIVKRTSFDGALSCMKIIFLRNAILFFYDTTEQSNSACFRKSGWVVFILTPSGILNGTTISLPIIIPARNITPQPPCCRLNLFGFWAP